MERESFFDFLIFKRWVCVSVLQMPNHTSQSRIRCWLTLLPACGILCCEQSSVIVLNPIIKGEVL